MQIAHFHKIIRPIGTKLLLGILAFWLFAACGSKNGLQVYNVGYLYDVDELAPKPQFVVEHINEEITTIHYRINTGNLLYMRNAETKKYEAKCFFKYQLLASFELLSPLDSGQIEIRDEAIEPDQKILIGSFDIRTHPKTLDGSYVLSFNLKDENRDQEFPDFLRINKSSESVASQFLLTDTVGNVLFKNHIPPNTPFKLKYSGVAPQTLWLSHYYRNFPIALPPYSSNVGQSFDLEPDTLFEINYGEVYQFKNPGFYHFRMDTSSWDGFTVLSFYKDFPFVSKKEHLGPPLRYITNRKEYKELSEKFEEPDDLKKVVDEFWLNRTGSVDRSRFVLQSFYERVQESNVYFSSYLEGWKTDRGIIYIVYGPPNKVYKSNTGEAWIYGDESSSLSYYFTFAKVKNPFSENDFELERMTNYRYGWGQAIEAWRNGHVYNSKDIKREQDEQDQSQFRQGSPYWN